MAPHLFTYQHYRYCLSIESAWIVAPILLAIAEFSPSEAGALERAALTAVAGVAGALSTALCFLETHPWLRDADRVGARVLFGGLLVIHGAGRARQPCGALTPAMVGASYLASRWITSQEPVPLTLATYIHLSFRFCGWWWVTFGIASAQPLWWCVLGSALYWLHILYSCVWTTRGDAAGFHAPAHFRRGLAEVIALSVALVAVALSPDPERLLKRLALGAAFAVTLAGRAHAAGVREKKAASRRNRKRA